VLKTDTIQITPELLGLIAEIDEFKGAWRLSASMHCVALPPLKASALRPASKAASYPTARLKDHFRRPISPGRLTPHGRGKGTWYVLS